MRLQMRRDEHRIISIDIVYGVSPPLAAAAIATVAHSLRVCETKIKINGKIVDIIVPSFISFHQFISLFSVSFLCAVCVHVAAIATAICSYIFGSNLNVFHSIQNYIKITIIRSAKPVLSSFFSYCKHIFIQSHTYYSIQFG